MYNNCTTNLWCEKLHTKYQLSLGESPGLVVMGGESFLKFIGSNPITIYWMDNFLHIFVVKL